MELQYGMSNLIVVYHVNAFNLYIFELVYDKLYYALTSQWTQPPLPKFQKEKTLHLSDKFPVFANVYCVNITRKGTQTFLKCECLIFERYGIPCSHILKIMNKFEESMIKIQHWKIYQVYFGGKNTKLSQELMKLTSIQYRNENMGVLISEGTLQECVQTWMIGM